mgnify:CR=1 FL=1
MASRILPPAKTNTQALAHSAGRGRPLEFRLLHVVEFASDGAIKRENVWVDLASIMQQLPQ